MPTRETPCALTRTRFRRGSGSDRSGLPLSRTLPKIRTQKFTGTNCDHVCQPLSIRVQHAGETKTSSRAQAAERRKRKGPKHVVQGFKARNKCGPAKIGPISSLPRLGTGKERHREGYKTHALEARERQRETDRAGHRGNLITLFGPPLPMQLPPLPGGFRECAIPLSGQEVPCLSLARTKRRCAAIDGSGCCCKEARRTTPALA